MSGRLSADACLSQFFNPIAVMAGLDPAIHVLTAVDLSKTWIRGSSPRMTNLGFGQGPRPSRRRSAAPQDEASRRRSAAPQDEASRRGFAAPQDEGLFYRFTFCLILRRTEGPSRRMETQRWVPGSSPGTTLRFWFRLSSNNFVSPRVYPGVQSGKFSGRRPWIPAQGRDDKC